MKVRWGVIGAGGIADRRTLPGMMLANNAELVSVMEINMAVATRLKDKYGARKAFDNVDALVADPDIDAVYIASPVVNHKEQAQKAACSGKHILIEKPVAFDIKDGLEILDTCRHSKVLIAAGFMMRYHSFHRKMKEVIQSGKLGQIITCRGQLTCWYPEIEGAWRQKLETSGGGALLDMGVHCIDLIQYLTGRKTKRVGAFTGNKTFKYEVEDSASVILELEDGPFVYVDSYFNIPDAAARSRLEIYGTKGSLLAEGTIGQAEGGKVEVYFSDDSLAYDAGQERNSDAGGLLKADFGNMYTKEIESFGESILTGRPPEVPAEEAIQVQKVVEAAYESSKTGRIITVI